MFCHAETHSTPPTSLLSSLALLLSLASFFYWHLSSLGLPTFPLTIPVISQNASIQVYDERSRHASKGVSHLHRPPKNVQHWWCYLLPKHPSRVCLQYRTGTRRGFHGLVMGEVGLTHEWDVTHSEFQIVSCSDMATNHHKWESTSLMDQMV